MQNHTEQFKENQDKLSPMQFNSLLLFGADLDKPIKLIKNEEGREILIEYTSAR